MIINSVSNTVQYRPQNNSPEAGQSTSNDPLAYIELPDINSYYQLEEHPDFKSIQAQFLNDIEQLKTVANTFVGEKFNSQMDQFYSNIEDPAYETQESLYLLYRDTRYIIHALLPLLQEPELSEQKKDAIALLLDDCLDDIDLCFHGVYSRFHQAYININIASEAIKDICFTIRQELYKNCIQVFLYELQQKHPNSITEDMHVHIATALYNLHCEKLGLPEIEDSYATLYPFKDYVPEFSKAVNFALHPANIIDKLVENWNDKLDAGLTQMGIEHWRTELINAKELTTERLEAIEDTLIKPANERLNTSSNHSLSISDVFELHDDDHYKLHRVKERFQAKAALIISNASGRPLCPVPLKSDLNLYIGTIDSLFFWVFRHDGALPTDASLSFSADNHTTLTLFHLQSVDFSSLLTPTAHAVLSQAIKQTTDPSHFAVFFLPTHTKNQYQHNPEILKLIRLHLCNILSSNQTFSDALIQSVCNRLLSKEHILTNDSLDWLIGTPIVNKILLTLVANKVDITCSTKNFNICHIQDLSTEELCKLFDKKKCQQLFKQAFLLVQEKTMALLLQTGHCDAMCNFLNSQECSPLMLFAERGDLASINYLLKISKLKINQTDKTNLYSALHIAAHYGHVECLEALLKSPEIDANIKNNKGYTPLHIAILSEQIQSVSTLLNSEKVNAHLTDKEFKSALQFAMKVKSVDIVQMVLGIPEYDVNKRDISKNTAIHTACKFGFDEGISILGTFASADLYAINLKGFNGLHYASKFGQLACVDFFLKNTHINVNDTTYVGSTPLHLATQFNHIPCMKALLAHQNIDINLKDYDGNTPLLIAAKLNLPEAIKLLLQKPSINNNACPSTQPAIRVNLRQGYLFGKGALSHAILKRHIECAKLLIADHRTDINQFSLLHTPLTLARKHGLTEIVDILENDSRLNHRRDHVLKVLKCQ